MRKRKIKRYAGEGDSLVDSGEEKLKQKGLEESKKERVGFLERLRMGNIDKPGSEAYEKFGAGRGRAVVAKERETVAAKEREKSAEDTSPMKIRSEYTGTRFGQSTPSEETSKPEIASGMAAGFDAERYLRDSGPKEANAKVSQIKPAPKSRKTSSPSSTSEKTGSGASGFPVSVGMESASAVMGRGRATTDGSGVSPLGKYTRDKEASSARNQRKMDLATERVKAGLGYKKGGKVSSASSRADGIAQRGKTKGRIC